MNWELPNAQAGFWRSRGTRNQIDNILWIMEKAREFQKNIYFCFIDYAKTFDCVDHNKLWKILKEMEYQILRNLYAGQEATVRTRHGATDWLKVRKRWGEVAQSCPTLCNPIEGSPPGSSIHGIFQARILEWVVISFSRGYSWPEIKLASPALQADTLPAEPVGNP